MAQVFDQHDNELNRSEERRQAQRKKSNETQTKQEEKKESKYAIEIRDVKRSKKNDHTHLIHCESLKVEVEMIQE